MKFIPFISGALGQRTLPENEEPAQLIALLSENEELAQRVLPKVSLLFSKFLFIRGQLFDRC